MLKTINVVLTLTESREMAKVARLSHEDGSVAEVIHSWPLFVGLPKGGGVEGVEATGHFLSHWVRARRAELMCNLENMSFSRGLCLPALSLPEKASQLHRSSTG